MTRVVVTGIGMVSPVGTGKNAFWDSLLSGRSGIGPVAAFDTAKFSVHIGAEVRDFDPGPYVVKQNPEDIGRASQLSIAAARLAVMDSGLDLETILPRRFGVSIGTTSGEPILVEHYNDIRLKQNPDAVPAEVFGQYPCHLIASHTARELGARGLALTIPAACAAGNFAIGYGFDLIRAGRADVMLAGGADSFSRIPYTGFARLGAIAPERCQPFDKNRKGMVPGEGSGVLVLEALDAAKKRRATIYAEVLGYGVSCDAHHMTAGHPQADGAIRAMSAALRESGKCPGDIDYISAHGTGTPTNDRLESLAVRSLFGERAPRLPVSSVKSMLGHTMGAASALEAAVCALALDTGWVPPTINHEEADPECGLDVVPNQARRVNPDVVLSNAYAFGGNNASLCLGRYR